MTIQRIQGQYKFIRFIQELARLGGRTIQKLNWITSQTKYLYNLIMMNGMDDGE